MYFKGKVRTKFKSTHKVCKKLLKNCDMSKYYCGIVGGDPPPQVQYFDISQFVYTVCTLCVCTFSSNFSFEIHCFAEVSVDFPMIWLVFLLIFVYYTPGDRAQKVIPGGAKTNASV